MISTQSLILLYLLSTITSAFITPPPTTSISKNDKHIQKFSSSPLPSSKTTTLLLQKNNKKTSSCTTTTTSLNAIVPVDPWFFTRMGLSISIMNIVTRKINRDALENLAWEQRLEESRSDKILRDPTLTELDLLREKGARSGRAYGNAARFEDDDDDDDVEGEVDYYRRIKTKSGQYRSSPNPRTLTDEEINAFESEYGVEYDPYYDEPYTEDELPTDMKYRTDYIYKDRRYENGEIFYYDDVNGVYYRQGSKPRKSKAFWKIW